MDPSSDPASLFNNPNDTSSPRNEPGVHHYGVCASDTFEELSVEDPVEPPKKCKLGLRRHYPNLKHGPLKAFSSDNDIWWVAFTNLPYAGLVMCIILLLVYARSIHGEFSRDIVVFIFAGIFGCLLYLLVVSEGFCSNVNKSLQNAMSVAAFQQKHKKLRLTVPRIEMRALAFHGQGSEKEISRIEKDTFPFSHCIDISPPMEEFQPGTIYRIDSGEKLEFLNRETAVQYGQMKKAMMKTANDDKKQAFQMTMVIPDHKEHITVYTERDCRACLISACLHRILVFFLCSWPYRLIFWYCTKTRKYTYVKIISV